jgi:hypothetical protein
LGCGGCSVISAFAGACLGGSSAPCAGACWVRPLAFCGSMASDESIRICRRLVGPLACGRLGGRSWAVSRPVDRSWVAGRARG